MSAWIRQVSPLEDAALLALGDNVVGLRMAMALIQLRCFCAQNRPDGLFATGKGFGAQVERAAGWSGKRGALIRALLEIGAVRGGESSGYLVVNDGVWGDDTEADGETGPDDDDDGSDEGGEGERWTPTPAQEPETPVLRLRKTKAKAGAVVGRIGDDKRAKTRERVARFRARQKALHQGVTPPDEALHQGVTPPDEALHRGVTPPDEALHRGVTPPDEALHQGVTPPDEALHQGVTALQPPAGARADCCFNNNINNSVKNKSTALSIQHSEEKDTLLSNQQAYSSAELVAARAIPPTGEAAAAVPEKISEKFSEKISASAVAATPRPEVAVPPPEPAPAAAALPAEAPVADADRVRMAFDAFWETYPASKRKSRPEAFAAWCQLSSVGALPPLEELFTRLWLQCHSRGWAQDGGRFIPRPAAWLADARWERTMSGEPRMVTEAGLRAIEEAVAQAKGRRHSAAPSAEASHPAEPTAEDALDAAILADLRAHSSEEPITPGCWSEKEPLADLIARQKASEEAEARIAGCIDDDLTRLPDPDDLRRLPWPVVSHVCRVVCHRPDLEGRLSRLHMDAASQGPPPEPGPSGPTPGRGSKAPTNAKAGVDIGQTVSALADSLRDRRPKQTGWKDLSRSMTHEERIAYLEANA